MKFTRDREDGDNFEGDLAEAAKTRRHFRERGYPGTGDLGRMLLSLEMNGSVFGVSERMDWDEDLSDVDGSHWG